MHRNGIRTTTIALLAIAALLLLVSSGRDGRDERVEPLARSGPVLAGDSVLWEATSADDTTLLRLWKEGAETSTVYRISPTRRRRDWGLSDIAASGIFVGFNRDWTECPPVPRSWGPRGPGCYRIGEDTLTGEIDGELKPLPRTRCLGLNDRGADFDIESPLAA
jgi:hypothetical protein